MSGPSRWRRRRVPVRHQSTQTECGATCVAMVASYHGRHTDPKEIRDDLGIGRDGANLLALAQAARRMGLQARGLRAPVASLDELTLPAIAHVDGDHFVVLESVVGDDVRLVDPAGGRERLSRERFAQRYDGVVLDLQPGEGFEPRARRRLDLFRFVADFLPRSRSRIVAVVTASVALVLLALLPPLVTRLVVDDVIPGGDRQLVFALAIGAAAFLLGHGAATLMRAELLLWLQTAIDRRMMVSFMRHLLSLPYRYFQVRPGGDLLVRVSSTAYVRDVVSGHLLSLAIDAALIGIYLVVIGVQSLAFVAALVAVATVQVVLMAITVGRAQRLAERELVTLGDAQSRLLETVGGIESIKSSGAEDAAFTRWAGSFHAQIGASIRRRRLDNLIDASLSGIRIATPVGMLLLGATMVIGGELTLGQMLALVALTGAALAPVAQLGQSLQTLQTVRVHLDRLRDVFDERPEQLDHGDRRIELRGGVELRGVSFAYGRGAAPALRDVDLSIPAGSRVAIVGPSGSGKSTLARLLLGLLPPTEGRVAFDGVDLDELDLVALRRQCGVVTQSADVLSGTIRDNITLADPDASDEDVRRAVRLADLEADISRMPMGLQTVLGETGAGLSGGQLQRLAIARALVHRPRLLVLDEATSHLDTATEASIADHVRGLRCTQVVIAHRLSTIRDADTILVLDQGAIVDRGTHDELLVTCPTYRDLVAAQLDGPPTRQPDLV